MKYLSLDLEATGLDENDLIIEFAVVPFCTETQEIAEDKSFHRYIQCPSFEELKPKLNPWVIEHNEPIISKAHELGLTMNQFKDELKDYLSSSVIRDYFELDQAPPTEKKQPKKIILFGKSMNAIDLPFLNRDLGWDFMRDLFHHQVMDLSSFLMGLIDLKKLPADCASGSGIMKFLGLGEVGHLALEDARNTAYIYLKLLEKFSSHSK